MKEERLKEIIRKKLNSELCPYCNEPVKYDGFEMSGFNGDHFHNLNIISKFKQYLHPLDNNDWRNNSFVVPIFWKGTCDIIKINGKNQTTETLEECLSGETSEEIILRVIKHQNPSILEKREGGKRKWQT